MQFMICQVSLISRVESVSGSSAGAIAATVLAMGLNPDAFREKLIRLAENHFEDIIKPITWWSPFRALRGYTLYGAASYRAFLNELFTDGEGIPHLKNKKIPNVMIHATNIGIGAPKVYDGTLEEDTIAEALFSSSALPFIFRNFPEQNSFIDGGLIDNFPVERIIGNSDGRDVFGFSFKKTSEYAFNGPLSYLAAMLFTSMDYSVERSLARIPKDNVYFIKTDIGILDFDKALELLKNKTNYNKEKQVIADALKDFVIKKREKI